MVGAVEDEVVVSEEGKGSGGSEMGRMGLVIDG